LGGSTNFFPVDLSDSFPYGLELLLTPLLLLFVIVALVEGFDFLLDVDLVLLSLTVSVKPPPPLVLLGTLALAVVELFDRGSHRVPTLPGFGFSRCILGGDRQKRIH